MVAISKLTREQECEVMALATDPSKRILLQDLVDFVEKEFGIKYTKAGMHYLLKRNGYQRGTAQVLVSNRVKAPVIPKPKPTTPTSNETTATNKPLLKSKKGTYYDTVAEFEAREREEMEAEKQKWDELKQLIKEA